MTDAVSNNLHAEEEVAKSGVRSSEYKPLHLLCKSHTCEKLDEACNALVSIERELKYGDLITKRQPQLKSFVRQTKCVALGAIKAMMKLVSHEESAKTTSMAKQFDVQLEEDGVYKSMSLLPVFDLFFPQDMFINSRQKKAVFVTFLKCSKYETPEYNIRNFFNVVIKKDH